jgi:exonuclease III
VISRLPRLHEWLDLAQPDVVCLQETKCAGDAFPDDRVAERGYRIGRASPSVVIALRKVAVWVERMSAATVSS